MWRFLNECIEKRREITAGCSTVNMFCFRVCACVVVTGTVNKCVSCTPVLNEMYFELILVHPLLALNL